MSATETDPDAASLDLSELCARAGVTSRTVRYYVQQGLLPSPGLGSAARYGQEHLDRLLLIRQLQREHLPLAEIRRRLEPLDAFALRALIATDTPAAGASVPASTDASADASGAASACGSASAAPPDSAADYVRAVLGRASPARSSAVSAAMGGRPVWHPAQGRPPSSPVRSQWERIALAPDIELHVRRPLSRDEGRRLDRLLEMARQILHEP